MARTTLIPGLLCVCAFVSGVIGAPPEQTLVSPPVKLPRGLVETDDPGAQWIHAWDAAACFVGERNSGSELSGVAWTEFDASDAFEIGRRVIDRRNAEHWVWLGVTMLIAGDERLAERAFTPARKADASLAAPIETAIELHARGEDPWGAFEADEESESGSGPGFERPRRGVREGYLRQEETRETHTWAPIDPSDIPALTEAVKAKCRQFQEQAGVSLTLFETDRFLFYSDLSAGENRKWTRELDRMYDTLLRTLEIPAGTPMFMGKCPVFVFRERADFIGFERDVFGVNAVNAAGLNHQRAGETFTVFFKSDNDVSFNSVLIHETVHAFMYRYRAAYPLPTWANEGLADYIAGHLTAYSPEPRDHWQHARNFVAGGGDPAEIMGQTYLNGGWFDENSYPVSHMLVRFMLKHKPRSFKEWIDDIKSGKDWEASLEARFNVEPQRLAEGFKQDIMSERGYSPIK